MIKSMGNDIDFERVCGCDEGNWYEDLGATKLYMFFSIISLTGQIIYLF